MYPNIRILTVSFAAFLSIVNLATAAPRKPSEAELLRFLEMPTYFTVSLADLKIEPLTLLHGSDAPSGSWQASGQYAVTPKEPLYRPKIDESLFVFSGFAGRPENAAYYPKAIDSKFLDPLCDEKSRFSTWIRIAAVPVGTTGWRFMVLDKKDQIPAWFEGKPRSAFDSGFVILNTPEATAQIARAKSTIEATRLIDRILGTKYSLEMEVTERLAREIPEPTQAQPSADGISLERKIQERNEEIDRRIKKEVNDIISAKAAQIRREHGLEP